MAFKDKGFALRAVKLTGGWLTIPLLLLSARAIGAKWTVGIYIGADNGMSEQAYVDIAEMMKVGSSSEVNIVVQVDNASRDTNPNCRRYLILKDQRELLADLGELDMADTAVLADFIAFLGRNFPARNYFLIIWDHGNGWRAGYGPQRAVVIDESHSHMMGVAGGELNRALANGVKRLGKKLKILGFDACLMGCIEVATEVMDYCEYLLASEAMVEWNGLPYDAIFRRLTTQPDIPVEQLLSGICEDYVNAYPDRAVCLSAISTAQLKQVIKTLSVVLKDSIGSDDRRVQTARLGVQTFPQDLVSQPKVNDEMIDLIHFWQLVGGNGTEKLCQALEGLVVANAVGGADFNNAQGLAVWFPFRYLGFKSKAKEYQQLVFSDSVPWLSFLNNYFGLDDAKPETPRIIKHQTGNRGDVRLWWHRVKDWSPVTYHLYQATAPASILQDHCDSFASWQSQGWAVSTRYSRSPGSSFFSGSASNLTHLLTLKSGVSLPAGGLLAFYAYYSTQETEDSLGNITRDACYIETSTDRQNWQILDSIYGSGESWQEFSYLLVPAENVYIRFRYTTDQTINRLGVFIDDIRIERFLTLRKALVTTDTTSYLFNLARETTGYYFFLMAQDASGNYSNLSSYYPVKIKTLAEPYTRPAPFSGQCQLILDFPAGETPDVYIYTLSGALVKKFSKVTNRMIDWDGKNEYGRDLADGVYLVLVRGKNFKKIGKIARVGVKG